MRNSCKFADEWHVNLPAFARKNTCNLQAKLAAIAHKITRNCRQKYSQLNTKLRAVSGKNTRNCRQSAINPRVNSPSNCRLVSLHLAKEVSRNLRALLHAIVCILRDRHAE